MNRRERRAAIAKGETEPRLAWRAASGTVAGLTLLWAGIAYFVYFRTVPMSGELVSAMLDQFLRARAFHPYALKVVLSLGLAFWIFWATCRFGAFVVDRLVPAASLYPLERLVFGSGLGLGALSAATFVLGLARLWYPAVFWGVLVLMTAVGALKGGRPEGLAVPPSQGPSPWSPLWRVLIVAFLVLFGMGGAMPEIFFDSLFYHLGVPNLYRLEHRIYRVDMVYSSFIMTPHMLWGFGLTLGNELVAKLLHGGMMAWVCAAFLALGQRWLSGGAGLVAAVLFVSVPAVGYIVSRAGVDGAWAFFQLLAAGAIMRSLAAPERGWLVLAGILAGFGASCRYQGLPFLPVACLLIAWTRWRDQGRDPRTALADMLWFAVPAGAIVAMYLLRNVAFHLNPVYPFAGTMIGEPRISAHKWLRLIGDARRTAPSVWYPLLHPWFMVMDRKGIYDGFSGPLFLVLLPLLFLVRFKTLELRFLWRLFLGLWAVWALTSPNTPRYALPFAILLCPLLAEMLLDLARTGWRHVLLAALGVGAVTNVYWTALDVFNLGGWPVVGGRTSERDYLGEQRPMYPTPPYDGIKWMNDHLPKDARVVFVGDSRSYPIDRRAFPSSVYDPQPIELLARKASDAAGLARLFREERITHVFVNFAEAMRTAEDYKLFTWDEASWRIFSEFWARHAKLAWKEERMTPGNLKALYVFEILGEEEAARPREPVLNPFAVWAPK